MARHVTVACRRLARAGRPGKPPMALVAVLLPWPVWLVAGVGSLAGVLALTVRRLDRDRTSVIGTRDSRWRGVRAAAGVRF
ncbi:MAG: hypothetical protein ABI051_18460 [Vicinamibacterales bacterium]